MSLQKVTYGFIPTAIDGCQLWLDGADSSTLSLSGTSVTQWNDKSTALNHANIVTATPPTYSSSSKAVVFTAANSTGIRGNMNSTSTNASVFIVSSYTYNSGSVAFPRLFILGSNDSTDNNLIGQLNLIDQPGQHVATYLGNGTGNAFGVANFQSGGTISLGTPYMYTNISTYSGTAFTNLTLVNGVTGTYTSKSGTMSPNSSYVGSYNRYSVGTYIYTTPGPNGDAFNGNVYEVIVYNVALTDPDRQKVEGYLAQKWSLKSSLPSDHPGLTTTFYRSDYTKTNIAKPIPYYAAFSPKTAGKCTLWLDAADASTVTLTTTTAFTETFSNAGVPTTSVYNANGVATGNPYAYLVGNASFSPYLTQANWTWNNLGGISYGQSAFAGVNPITSISGSLGYSAFIQVNSSTPSTLVRTTTIPVGVSCTVSFWYSSRDNAAMPLSIGVKYGATTIVTITQPISASAWTNSTTTFITSVGSQNLVFTVTQDGTNSYYSGDQTANIAYVQVTYSTVTNVADKSGNGVVLSNATGFTYPNNSFNGTYPSFLCTSGGQGQLNAAATLGYNAAFAQTTPFTVFFVSHQTETASGGYIMDSQSGGSRQYTYGGVLGSPFGNTGTSVSLNPFIVSQSWIAGTSVLYLNGTSSYSGSLSSFTTGGIIVGNRYSINESWPGHICELIYYSGQLGTTQRQQVESYLAQKWGLTSYLPGSHQHFTQQTGAITTVANTKFSMVGLPRVVFASSGLAITHQDGRVWKATVNNPGYANYSIGLNSGTSMSLTIYAGSDVFNSAGGRVALFNNGDSNNAVRHAGYVMWTYTFTANNYDWGWKFVSSGSGYLIYNDYPAIGTGWQVSYDPSADRVLIVAPSDAKYGMVWNITPKVTLAYVYSSY